MVSKMMEQTEEVGKLHGPDYEDDWIWKGLHKHKANYSMVLCFETGDPARFKQLKDFFREVSDDEYRNCSIYVFDPWNGLGRLDKSTGDMNYDIHQKGKRFGEETGEKLQDLAQSLNIMDSKLHENQTVFILYGITPQVEGKTYLLSALRSWANSKKLISARSLVILIGFSMEWLDEDTRDLLAMIEVEAGRESEYENLIGYLADIFGISLNQEEKGAIKSALKGLNLHQSEAILRESYALKGCFDLEQIKISKGEQVRKTGILEVEEPVENFDFIGGYEEVKDFIKQKIIRVMHLSERARKFAIPLPRGILLFGPPGTGKTLFAKALATEVKLPFINFKTENIYSQWLGESGRKMKTAIRTAEDMSPAIVFVDEIDRFGRRAAATDSAGEETRRVFSQLLEWLGDAKRKATVVGTTNRPEDLDEAFLRTGRFDYKIPILYPDEKARLKILCIHLGIPDEEGKKSPKPKPPLALSDDEFLDFMKEEIVPATEGYTGAELEELVIRAKRNAFERDAEGVAEDDFRKSLKLFRVNLKERKRQLEIYQELARKFTDDITFLKGLNHKIRDLKDEI